MSTRKPQKKVTFDTDAPCPCGSGRTIETCHLDPIDGRFRKKVPSLRPPGRPTGYAHPKCYLRTTRNCSNKISQEHYISESVLKQIGEFVKISGAHWLDEGHTHEGPMGDFTAGILCKRHNEALSPLDSEAGIFFGALADALTDLKERPLSRKPIFHLISGEALELWMLKTACGHYFGPGTYRGAKLEQNCTIDLEKAVKALIDRHWEPACGLYVGSRTKPAGATEVGAIVDGGQKKLIGVKVGLLGFEFFLSFDSENACPELLTGLPKRPTELTFRRECHSHTIILTWPIGHPERFLEFSYQPP